MNAESEKLGSVTPRRFFSRPSKRDTWCTIGLHHLLAPHNFEDQGPASSQPRDMRCRENLGPEPTTSPGEVRTVRSRRTRGARLSLLSISLIVISINKGYPFHIRERRKHMVTTHGYLGVIERTAQRAEVSGLAAEGITVFSRC
jgi:hypothetical protein